MNGTRRNIELKARCADLAAAEEAARRLGAKRAGVLRQIDTYFHAPLGRLKLRQTEGGRAELIAYERPNDPAARGSDYHLAPTDGADALLRALTAALGVRGEVRKVRTLYLWHNVRIHLDEVAGLGSFLEFEAVLSAADDEATGFARVADLRRALGVGDSDLIAGSYSDLLGL